MIRAVLAAPLVAAAVACGMNLDADPEAINATVGIIALVGDEARFRTESGGAIRFERHAGEKEFPGCD